ncbi:hypothetical protein ES703_95248 [subsurface metagenome]
MNKLTQLKNTSQARYKFSKFNPGTNTSTWVEREINITDGSLRKPEIGEYEKRHIEKIKERSKGLNPEILQSIIQAYKNKVLRNPVDDHPPPGPNAPKQWSEKREEHKKDTQRQEAKPRRMSIAKAEARKNGATDGYHAHGATKKKDLKRGDPGFYTDWTGSESEYPDEKETQHQEPTPKEKEPGPKTKAKLLHLPNYPKPPQEIWDWCKDHYWAGEWKRILRALHKYSLYRKRNEDKYYHGKSERKNRQYILGQIWLADKLEISRKTVEKWLHRFEDDGIIYIPQRGRFDRGASLIELAYTEAHRRMNKQKTTQRKNPSSIR